MIKYNIIFQLIITIITNVSLSSHPSKREKKARTLLFPCILKWNRLIHILSIVRSISKSQQVSSALYIWRESFNILSEVNLNKTKYKAYNSCNSNNCSNNIYSLRRLQIIVSFYIPKFCIINNMNRMTCACAKEEFIEINANDLTCYHRSETQTMNIGVRFLWLWPVLVLWTDYSLLPLMINE